MLKITILTFFLMLCFSRETRAGEKSLYDFLWLDPDKKVYVLQNKLHKKERTFYVDVGYLTNFTSKFQDTSGFQGKLGYFVHEDWGLELFYNKYSNKDNDSYAEVRQLNGSEPFIRSFDSTYGALVIWSPFYGKINTFNQIYYFDWALGAGVAKINAKSNIKTVVVSTDSDTSFSNEQYTGMVLKTNVKFHLTERVHVGAEYMNTYYKAAGPKDPTNKKIRTNTDVVLSVGFSY